MRFARHHEAQIPAVHLALEVAADDAARCAGLPARRHLADPGQPQLAVALALAWCEAQILAVVLKPKPGNRSFALKRGKPGSSSAATRRKNALKVRSKRF
jgi:hypothetical protein